MLYQFGFVCVCVLCVYSGILTFHFRSGTHSFDGFLLVPTELLKESGHLEKYGSFLFPKVSPGVLCAHPSKREACLSTDTVS